MENKSKKVRHSKNSEAQMLHELPQWMLKCSRIAHIVVSETVNQMLKIKTAAKMTDL